MSTLSMKVLEAYSRDVGRGIVRIDYRSMDLIGATIGSVAEITGKRRTVARCMPLYSSDGVKGVIRIDGIVRNNARVAIGDTVEVKKVRVLQASRIQASPLGPVPPIDDRYLADALEGVPIIMGNKVMVPYFSSRIIFQIKSITPNVTSDTAAIITPKTICSIVEAAEESLGVTPVSYEDIGGLKDEVQKVREMIELPLRHPEIFEKLGVEAPKGVLLYGPPGTGKTLLAKAVANESNAHFISISGPEIMSKFYGESEAKLREIFKEARERAPTIMFIDELDSIAPKREDVRGEVERRIVSQILSLMDGLEERGRVVIIAATNRPNFLDPALRRPGRFDREIEIKVPDKFGRLEILQIHTRNMPLDSGVDQSKIASVTHGFVGADLEYLCKEAAMHCLRRVLPEVNLHEDKVPPESLDRLVVTHNDFEHAITDVMPSAMREVFLESPDVRWSDIGGLEEVKRQLQEAVEWPLKYPELYSKIGHTVPKGVLLHGPSGTGKTLLAKAVSSESDANFLSVKGPELFSKWIGESERGVREIFRRARQASPCVVFFDELDAVAPVRGAQDSGGGTSGRMVSQIQTEMDGISELGGVVVLAATNRPEVIEPALLRPGRFDKIILVPSPDKKTRKQILSIHSKGRPLAREVDLGRISEMTDGFSGADLAAVANTAASIVLHRYLAKYPSSEEAAKHASEAEISASDFEDAVEKVRSQREMKRQKLSVSHFM
jgi:transitional endoplasmic reticulum ATPase